MDKEIKTKWIKALRSGEYKQTTELLRRGDAFCCLGVLCDLYAKDNEDGEWSVTRGDDGFATVDSVYTHSSIPPTDVVNWADLGNTNPVVKVGELENPLAVWNDEGKSFEQIADIIENNL